MPSRTAVEAWVAAYVEAWASNDAEQIGALFTDEAVYFRRPFEPDAWSGREGIVRGWLDNCDEPGSWEFTWRILGVDGDLAFVQGETLYPEPTPSYDNLWVLAFEGDGGRVREFTEWLYEREHATPTAGS
jgi:ketosteroid isomerase-like protein